MRKAVMKYKGRQLSTLDVKEWGGIVLMPGVESTAPEFGSKVPNYLKYKTRHKVPPRNNELISS